MSGINYDELFKTIVDANNKNNNEGGNSKNILKTDTIGNTIIGRLVLNLKDVPNSIFHYYHHGWKSRLDNFGIFTLCPNTYKEKCPICARSIKMWKSGDEAQKKESEGIRRRDNFLVNFFVISDAKHPENNGTLKILRYGVQIDKKIKMATEGIDKDSYGSRVWRLDDQGCNFRIICEENAEKGKGSSERKWPTYNNSGFLPPSKIEGMTEAKEKEIFAGVFDLANMYTRKSYDDMLKEMNKHYFVNEVQDLGSMQTQSTPSVGDAGQVSSPASTPVATPPATQGAGTATTPPATVSTPVPMVPTTSTPVDKPATGQVSEDQLDSMLAELQGKK